MKKTYVSPLSVEVSVAIAAGSTPTPPPASRHLPSGMGGFFARALRVAKSKTSQLGKSWFSSKKVCFFMIAIQNIFVALTYPSLYR